MLTCFRQAKIDAEAAAAAPVVKEAVEEDKSENEEEAVAGVEAVEGLQPGATAVTAAAANSGPDLEKIATRVVSCSASTNDGEADISQPQAIKTLHPIFKQAKTFETQRLIKKIKFLRSAIYVFCYS
jgi:hypothetical protein